MSAWSAPASTPPTNARKACKRNRNVPTVREFMLRHIDGAVYIELPLDLDHEETLEGAPSSNRIPSNANRVSIKKLADTISILQNNQLEVKNTISARQCYEQQCENYRPSTSQSRRHSCCPALTASEHLSSLLSSEDYLSWRQLGRIAWEIQETRRNPARWKKQQTLLLNTNLRKKQATPATYKRF